MAELKPAMRDALVEALDAYENAGLGELNTTAEALYRACTAAGWQGHGYGGEPPRLWAPRVLGRPVPPRPGS